ncbi:enoyl-CoA hydratase/isomerase family protein [Longimicrobium sp.]|uniref:enoyl-CoA hydratase/isomerase family protein n=1 Tax=Longimicrobium sp. TaxID=2029185 RepID=UPI002CE4B692|nr:enoyl-CoA hydratase-related protein [Longimicrobium sp.]HSU16260.1 enoyl-CoA hydratase-related protein [Longimicrobium sp.]
MPDFETIRLDRDAAVAILTIDRPEKRNALSSAVRAELIAALDQLRGDDGVRVIVITGAGDKAFVAGADIAEFAQRTPLEQRAAMAGRTVFAEIAAHPKPVIAMINGFCLGGGCELALACDIRIASDAAKLGQPEINLGIIPGGGGTQRLPRVVGTGQAMRLVLSGELIDAAEALRIGLVDVVHPAAELRERTLEFARKMAEKSPVALRMAKSAIRAAAEMPLSAGDAYETELFITCFGSDDRREGVAAFMEKRPASFTGR